MEKLNIRKYKEEDYEKLKKLWELQFGEDKAKEIALYFKWLIEGNPFSNTQDDYFVVSENGNLIAYDGLMPFRFSILGKDHDGYIYHDTLVHPEKRGQGLGSKLIKEIGQRKKSFSIAVWMNLPNSKMFEKCGWLAVNKICSYAMIYNTAPFINIKNKIFNYLAVKTINLVLGAWHKYKKILIGSSYDNYDISEINEFDGRFDELFHSVKKNFGIIPYRTKDVLNWKYSNRAFSNCTRLICTEKQRVKGYIIYRTEIAEKKISKTTIFDFLFIPERKDAFIALLKRAIQEIEKTSPDFIEILSTNQDVIAALKYLGFIKVRKKDFAMKFMHSSTLETSTDISNGNNWFFTYGDGDNPFWHAW